MGCPPQGVEEEGQDEGTNLDHKRVKLRLQSHLSLGQTSQISQGQTDVSYLTSYWSHPSRPRGGDVGVGAGGRVAGSWTADESHPGVPKGWSYSGSFHLHLRGLH